MTTDMDLIELIEQLRECAVRSLHDEHVGGVESPKDVPSIWEVAKPLEDAMNAHPDFAKPCSRSFLGKQIPFFNHHQSVNLLRVASRNGAVEALAWYRRVMATKFTKMRVVAEVYGLSVQQRETFSNGVSLLPVSELPDSPNSLFLKRPMYIGPGAQFPAAVMIEIEDVPDEEPEAGHGRFVEISETMRKTVTAFVLSDDAAPTMAVGWQEFADPELEAAEVGRSWMGSLHEGRLPHFPEDVTDEMLQWVEKYLKLPPEVASACEVSLARLNLARRRVAPGDKAIDGSVCLEALLSGRSRGELTHKISVRAALLLGHSLDERRKIAEKVRKFYSLRSDVVHGSASKKEGANRETADEGLSLCLAVLRSVVTSARVPDPELWELTGGPVWNRYTEPETGGH
jgi:Apea-like HEPN